MEDFEEFFKDYTKIDFLESFEPTNFNPSDRYFQIEKNEEDDEHSYHEQETSKDFLISSNNAIKLVNGSENFIEKMSALIAFENCDFILEILLK